MRYNSILLNKLRSNTLFLLTFLLCLFLNPFFGQNKGLKKEEVDIGDMSFGYPKYAKDLIQRKLGDYQNISDEILVQMYLLTIQMNFQLKKKMKMKNKL